MVRGCGAVAAWRTRPAVVKSGDCQEVCASKNGSTTNVTSEIQLGRMETRSIRG